MFEGSVSMGLVAALYISFVWIPLSTIVATFLPENGSGLSRFFFAGYDQYGIILGLSDAKKYRVLKVFSLAILLVLLATCSPWWVTVIGLFFWVIPPLIWGIALVSSGGD